MNFWKNFKLLALGSEYQMDSVFQMLIRRHMHIRVCEKGGRGDAVCMSVCKWEGEKKRESQKDEGNEGEACKSGASSPPVRLKIKKHRSCFLADKSN